VEYLLGGQNNMNFIDINVKNYFALTRTSSLTEYMYLLSNIFDVSVYSVLILFCFTILVYLFRGIKYSVFFLSTVVSTAVLVYVLKVLFNVARPDGGVMSAFGQSFPSYHATMSAVFFIILIYIFDDYLKSAIRFVFNFACIFMIFAVSFSRIYLGVHWFSDVFAGVILGGFIVYLSIKIFKRFSLL
jgi:undecaprenyl-diphosphatase